MEHIINIAVDVDDERIRSICEKSAAEQIINEVKTYSHGFKGYYGSDLNKEPVQLKDLFVAEIAKCVKKHEDEIIKLAVQSVVDTIKKSKKYKEALQSVVDSEV